MGFLSKSYRVGFSFLLRSDLLILWAFLKVYFDSRPFPPKLRLSTNVPFSCNWSLGCV
jgi:hypothetical protein